ncbi:hypothetical protein, partial [Haliangium sp.]|uniref:hypothetical protein n=1 Tax=Haliangium sp. TaxID=2663208 RepID=UPI003D124DBC
KQSARSFPFEVAAAVASRLFSQARSNHNFNRAPLPVYGRPRSISRDAVNDAINAGVTVVVEPERGTHSGAFVRPVSCAVTDQTRQTTAIDRRWQPIEIAKTVAFLLRQVELELDRFTQTATADEETRISVIAACQAVLRAAEGQALLGPVSNESVLAAYELVGGATHLVVALEYGVRTALDIIAVQHNVTRAV